MNTSLILPKSSSKIKHINGVIRTVSQFTIKGNRILQITNSKGRDRLTNPFIFNIQINDALYQNIAKSFPVKTAVKLRFTDSNNIQFISLSKLP